MSANIFNNSELLLVQINQRNVHQINLRTPGIFGAITGTKRDNRVFVKEKWSKNNENSNFFKACC